MYPVLTFPLCCLAMGPECGVISIALGCFPVEGVVKVGCATTTGMEVLLVKLVLGMCFSPEIIVTLCVARLHCPDFDWKCPATVADLPIDPGNGVTVIRFG